MRGAIKSLIATLLLMIILWIGLWWYAQSRLQRGFESWARNFSERGSVVINTKLQRGMLPVRASLTIARVILIIPFNQNNVSRSLDISLSGFKLWVDVFNPFVIHVGVQNSILIGLNNSPVGIIKFDSLSVISKINPSELFGNPLYVTNGGDASATDLSFTPDGDSTPSWHVDNFVFHQTLNLKAKQNQQALFLRCNIDGESLPLVIPFYSKITHEEFSVSVSGPVPADLITLNDRLRVIPTRDQPERMRLLLREAHVWAKGGIRITAKASVTIGPSTAVADSTTNFDHIAQPSGTADVSANHLDLFTMDIVNKYPKFLPAVAQLEVRLEPYMLATDHDGQVLKAHVDYGSSGVIINGNKVADWHPIDWNAIENPPPPEPITSQYSDGYETSVMPSPYITNSPEVSLPPPVNKSP